MAVLERLSIRGIRSFGPNDEEKVKFSTPLTLFLGQNGCGKTTIIECLKYALTGEYPAGTGSGSGFLNDPKLSNKTSIKSAVKVRFKDCKGDYVTVGKFAEVSMQAGGKLKFKSMNPSIRWEDGKGIKEPEDIGGRCADIDMYCAQKLNVSRAIINNVIFCHQENSAWPLDEAKKLKVKFDEIFGATEYNKCVERLRKLVKDKKVNVKVLKAEFEQKKTVKKAVDKLKDSLNSKEEQLQINQEVIDQKQKELEPLEKRIREICDLEDVLNQLQQKLSGLEKTLESVIQHQRDLKKYIHEEYEGSDEDLQNAIMNFKNNQEKINKTVLEMEEKKVKIEATLVKINKEMQELQRAFGQLKAEENLHNKRREELSVVVKKAKNKLNVTADEAEPVLGVLSKLKTAIKLKEENLNDVIKNKEQEERQLQDAINGIRDKFVSAKEALSSKTKAVTDANKKIKESKMKLNRLALSSSQIEIVENKIKSIQESLEKRKAEFKEEEQQMALEELDSEIVQKEQGLTKLDREYKILQQNFATEQNIQREKNVIIEKKIEVDEIKQKHEENFQVLFGDDVPQVNFEESVKNIQKREGDKLKGINKNISDCEKKVTVLEGVIKHANEKLISHKEELKQNQMKIDNICKGRDFSDVLNQSYNKKEKLQRNKGTFRSANTLFEQFIDQFEQEKPCCPICETDFSEKQNLVQNIIRTLKSKIEELPGKITVTESELKKEEEFYNKLQQLKSVNDEIEALREAKIPLLEEDVHQNKGKLQEVNLELLALETEVLEPEKLMEITKVVISDAVLLDRLIFDLNKSENLIETLRLDLVDVPSSRTLDETDAELNKVKADLSNLRRQYRTKRDLFDDTKSRLQILNGQLQTEIQKKLQMQELVQEQPLLDAQIKECKGEISKLEEEMNVLRETITVLQAELDGAEKNRVKVMSKNKQDVEVTRLAFEEDKGVISDIQKLQNIIEQYEKGDNQTKLERNSELINKHKEDIVKLENAKKTLNESIIKRKEELASQDSKLRALKDNQELRENKKKSCKLEEEVNELKNQIGDRDNKSIYDEKRRICQKVDFISKQINEKNGEQNNLKQNIRDIQKDLNLKEHREATNEFRKKFYELKIEELAIDDLDVYTQALEKSILKFHQERMVQINMTIRELWRSIYKGNDIDYIEIQTVDEIGGGGNRKRSYDYKVVQVKKGVELEMRGRCSAGQRVLACLVIRMALAETFSANCGILALDEPTTNLDRDNIISLSDALSKIISAREKQKNFQLLIITHDEDFLQTLTRDQSVSHYYKVRRNADGFSQIKKEVL